jgi:opacity protein-like surface antigen
MIRKFAAVPRFRVALWLSFFLTILAGAGLQAQQTPSEPTQAPSTPPPSTAAPAAPAQPQAAQAPDQSSSSQEASTDDTKPGRKLKVRDYKTWSFNVGGGANLPTGTTDKYVRGGGGVIAVGVARNYSKYFGLRADFQWDNLPLRSSTLQSAEASGATSHVYSLMVDPVINIQVTKRWGGYAVIGASYYHRSGELDSSTAIPGSACNGFWDWWGVCHALSLPLNGKFLSSSLNQFGYNLGGGVTRKIRPNVELYAEFRYLHGKHDNITTDLRPITVGVRW